jgi:hypothetical protein
MASQAEDLFADCVCLVFGVKIDSLKSTLQDKLQNYGAKIVKRITKDITHVVAVSNNRGNDAEQTALLDLFTKISKVIEFLICSRLL